MKRKQNLIKTRPKKGDARTEYGEQKERCNLSLTPTAIASLDKAAEAEGISRSELVERFARSLEATGARLDFVFDDWRKQEDGQSVYGTQEDCDSDLSTGQFHSGTTYKGVLFMDKWARDEIVRRIKEGYTPVFWCAEPRRESTTSGNGSLSVYPQMETTPTINQCPICGEPAKKKYCSIKCSNTAQARKSQEVRKKRRSPTK